MYSFSCVAAAARRSRTMFSTYHYHCVGVTGNGCRFRLTLFGSVANCIHNVYIITLFRKNINYIFKFLVIKCRLCHNTKFPGWFLTIIFCLRNASDHCSCAIAPAIDSFHFRMVCIADNDNTASFLIFFLNNAMDLADKRTGRINNANLFVFQLMIHVCADAM